MGPPLPAITGKSTTKRLPAPSKARSPGLLIPETKVLFTPSGVNLKIEFFSACPTLSETKRLPERSKAMPKELMPLTNVLFLPLGPNLRIERWLLAVLAAPYETTRFPLQSKHRPSTNISPVVQALFVP